MKKTILTLFLPVLILASCNNGNNKAQKENNMKAQTTDSTTFKSGYSDVNGIKMYYEMHGNSGRFLVLIHGGGSTIESTFGKILPLLAKNHKVIAVELQAHGRTSDRNAPESFEQDADDVTQLLKNLHVPKASFFGFSNGGNTTMQIGIRHPEMVDKLVIASAFYKREGMFPGFFDGMEKTTFNDMPKSLKDAFLKVNPDHDKLLNMFNKDRQRMVTFKDWSDDMLRSIKAPSLVINADRDVASNSHVVAMANLISNSRLMILPGTHGSYLGESGTADNKTYKMTVEIINDFLNNK